MSFADPTPHIPPDSECFLATQERLLLANRDGTVFCPHLLPESLRQWSGWLRKDPAKPKKPLGRNAKDQWISPGWNKPGNQVAFVEALSPDGRAGIHARDGLIVVDFDGVIDPTTGQLTEAVVQKTLEQLNTYASFSSSGTGLHVFAKTSNVELQRKYNLRIRDNGSRKLGEWLGNGFVALTGVAIPEYSERPVVDLSEAQEQYIFENLLTLRVESEDHASLSTLSNDFLGIDPTPSYRTHFLNLLSWKRPYGMNDTSHSVWNQYLLRAYFQGDENQRPLGAVSLSIKYENHFMSTAPFEWRRKHLKKLLQWHQGEVLKALEYVQEKGRLLFTAGGSDYLATPFEVQSAHFMKHILIDKNLSPSAVRLAGMVVAIADGRSEVVITNLQMAELLSCDERTVRRRNSELSSHSCISYDRSQLGTTYNLQLDQPCIS
jgi:hypothetical protein